MEIIPACFELRVSYDWWAIASKLPPKHFTFSFEHFFDFSHNNCGCGMCSQATPKRLAVLRMPIWELEDHGSKPLVTNQVSQPSPYTPMRATTMFIMHEGISP